MGQAIWVDRRALLGAAAAFAVAPAARGQASDSVAFYYDRLRARLADAGGGRFIAAAEDLLLGEHNGFRARQGLGALARHEALDRAARAHAADMVDRDYFEHAAPEGFTSVERVGLLGRRFVGLAGENIVEVRGGPPSSAAELAELWRDSPGHRANMLRATYTHVGFGVARRGDRTVAATAFGQRYADLPEPVAFRVDGLEPVARALISSGAMRGFALEPVGGGRSLGPFWLEDPAEPLRLSGAYAIKPYFNDPATPHRFLIVDGPIVQA